MKKIKWLFLMMIVGTLCSLFAQFPNIHIQKKGDLKVKIKRCPSSAIQGAKLKNSFSVEVISTFSKKLERVAVDIVLSSKKNVSANSYASYSPNYKDGVLLKGGREIITIPPNGKVKVKLNGSNKIPDDTPVGKYYLAAVVDAGNKIREINERNNVSYCKINIRGKIRRVSLPDLAITKIGLDKDCHVVVEVKNRGKGKLPDSVWTKHTPKSAGVYIYVDGKKWGGASIWGFDPNKNLQNPGGTAKYVSNYKVSDKAKIKAVVDMWNQVKESNERNNAKTKELRCIKFIPGGIIKGKVKPLPLLPDLVITKIGLDKDCHVVIEVKNRGKGKLPDSVWTKHTPKSAGVYIYVDGKKWGGASIWGFDSNKNLQNPGGTAKYVSNYKVSDKAKIKAVVDMWNQVKESNERNNKKEKLVKCLKIIPGVIKGKELRPIELPDLKAQNISVNNSCSLKITIKNVGNVELPDNAYSDQGVGLQMYIWKDGAWKPWGGIILSGVDPNKKLKAPHSSITFDWFPRVQNLKLSPGKHKVKLVVDITNKLTEKNENNNVIIKTVNCRKGIIKPTENLSPNIKTPKEIPVKPRNVTPREKVEGMHGM
ncbi:CARDB domain-containing protein [Nitrosophilus kaiyonis]|uniref:CARDB domain-containing protein n=1 Tax=Nitrosophilus kaiyonis TaxID=2930200 RepID=UPI0024931549|nr:CARDB domain-containing protein [Nitrosophilus kaiyonis]